MDYEDALMELKYVIDELSRVMDGMGESTEDSENDDTNNEYILKIIISHLDDVINSMSDSNEKGELKSAKDEMKRVKDNIADNIDISDKIERLFSAQVTIEDVKNKLFSQGHL